MAAIPQEVVAPVHGGLDLAMGKADSEIAPKPRPNNLADIHSAPDGFLNWLQIMFRPENTNKHVFCLTVIAVVKKRFVFV